MPTDAPLNPRPRDAVLVFVTCFCAYVLTLSRAYSGYEGETIAQARAIMEGGDVTGRAGLLSVAFYLPFVAMDALIRARGWFWNFHGLLPNFATALATSMTAVLVYLTAFEIWRDRRATRIALLFAFASMAWPYSKMGMETALALATALSFWGFVREIERPGSGGLAIFATGLAALALTKVHAPVVIALFALLYLWQLRRGRVPWPSRGAIALSVAILAAGVALYVTGNLLRYGRPWFSTSYSLSWEAAPPPAYIWNVWGLLASPGKSLFIYSPVLIAALACSRDFWRTRGWFVGVLVGLVVPQILFHAYFRTWADETWGPRRLLNLLPILILPLGMLWDEALAGRRWRRALLAATATAGVAMQLVAVSVNYAHYSWTLAPHGLASTETMAWNPQLTHYRFASRLAISTAARALGERSHVLSVAPGVLDWNTRQYFDEHATREIRAVRPYEPPADQVAPERIDLDLGLYDEHFDLWWLTPAGPGGEGPAIGIKTKLFVILMAAAGLASLLLLAMGRVEPTRGEGKGT